MSDKVISLHGKPLPEAGTPSATVIAELERLLAAARAGEVIGLAGCYLHRDRSTSFSFAGQVGGFALIGALECVKQRVMRIVLSKEGR